MNGKSLRKSILLFLLISQSLASKEQELCSKYFSSIQQEEEDAKQCCADDSDVCKEARFEVTERWKQYHILCPHKARSCEELLKQGKRKSGIYYIDPDGEGGFNVSCDMQTDGGGWTVFQRRKDGSVDFNRGWKEYKNGFGEMNGEFWLGLDKIHRITHSKDESLRVDLEDFESNKAYAKYSGFKVDNEGQQYRLCVWGYSGDAGDSLAWHNGMDFTTMDRDNDKASWGNCARFYGAWWYNKCHHSNLNGHYYNINPKQVSEGKGIQWKTWKGYHYSLKKCEMKLRCS